MTTTAAPRTHAGAPDAEPGFAAKIRTATAQRHSSAEHSGFMTELMGGRLDVAAYRRLLGQYRHIYTALEEVSAHFRAHPSEITAPFVQEGLDRSEAILHDLEALDGVVPAEDPALPATQEYVRRILATKDSPERFLAHHYLRYLGDLSGGQAGAALMARHYGISADALSMYRFPDLPKPKVFKDGYRTLLDEAPMTEQQRENLLDEAIRGFDLNAQLFGQLSQG